MENISHFLRACQSPPLNLQPHDVFLTVDLYESKDPAQVIQCIGAFSRVANKCAPSRFPTVIGPGLRPGLVSPQGTGTPKVGGGSYGNRDRGTSNASNTSSAYNSNSRAVGSLTPTRTGDSNSGRYSPTKNGSGPLSPGTVSSWSKKEDEITTAPAWNINQYGYMGGASQGNMGVTFGARRQITSAGPHVPSLAEKEKKRREQEAEEERLRKQMEEAERRRRVEREAEEERARIAEEERWAEETRKLREQERKNAEEKRQWEEEERRWKIEEEKRQQEEKEAEAKLEAERRRVRGGSDARLQGQFLSQYQAEQAKTRGDSENLSRIQELERELELARERERQYELERQERLRAKERRSIEDHDLLIRMKEERPKSRARSRSRPREPQKSSDEAWREDEREYLKREWAKQHDDPPPKPPRQYEDAPPKPPRPQQEEALAKPPRPLPEPAPVRVKTNNTGPSSRPLPDPAAYTAPTATYSTPTPALPSRTDRFLSSNPAPQQQALQTTYASELSAFDSTAERDAEDRRRQQSQANTKAGGWASKSLLEREMEMERQRQREWEEAQAQRVAGGAGAASGAGRRGIVGPRPPPTGR